MVNKIKHKYGIIRDRNKILEEVCVLFGTNYHFEIKKKYRVIRNAYLFMSNGLCAEKKRREMHKNAFGKM